MGSPTSSHSRGSYSSNSHYAASNYHPRSYFSTLPPFPPPANPNCKLFVGGLAGNVTNHEFYLYFARYGSVIDSVVMIDKETGNSRGFGFITYDEQRSADEVMRVMNAEGHVIMKKPVEVKRAEPKGGMKAIKDMPGQHNVPTPNASYNGNAVGRYGNSNSSQFAVDTAVSSSNSESLAETTVNNSAYNPHNPQYRGNSKQYNSNPSYNSYNSYNSHNSKSQGASYHKPKSTNLPYDASYQYQAPYQQYSFGGAYVDPATLAAAVAGGYYAPSTAGGYVDVNGLTAQYTTDGTAYYYAAPAYGTGAVPYGAAQYGTAAYAQMPGTYGYAAAPIPFVAGAGYPMAAPEGYGAAGGGYEEGETEGAEQGELEDGGEVTEGGGAGQETGAPGGE
jgi:RNA recognition motif-containing protein